MKVFSVIGFSESGKTTTIENIISELKRRGYSVGSVKQIRNEKFALDQEGKNTYRQKLAGSELVTARGTNETDIMFQEMLPVEKILKSYDQDFVVMEGVRDCNSPKIVCAKTIEEIDRNLDDTVFAISGRVSNNIKEYNGLPVIDSVENTKEMVNLIEEKVYDKLPDFENGQCSACRYGCRDMGIRILKGKATRDNCAILKSKVKLYINGKPIKMVPFVQKVFFNMIKGFVSELKGYEPDTPIEIKIE